MLVRAKPTDKLDYIARDLRRIAVLIKSLKLDPRNPRRGDVPLVANSLYEHGQESPIKIYQFPGEDAYTVIAGNHRVKAALTEIKEGVVKRGKEKVTARIYRLPGEDQWVQGDNRLSKKEIHTILANGKTIKPPWKFIAASVYEGSPEKAQAFALMDNRSSDVASYDDETLAELLKESKDKLGDTLFASSGYKDEDLTYLLSRMEAQELLVEDEDGVIESNYEEIAQEGENFYSEDKKGLDLPSPDIIFPSSSKWEIPDLRRDMLGDPPSNKIQTFPGEKYMDKNWDGDWYVVWGWSTKGAPYDRSILSFYTDDPALWPLWTNPTQYARNFVNQGIKTAIAPGFSIWMERPFPERIWGMYMMQWLARYYQECGIKIIPDVPVPIPPADYKWQCAGIPVDSPCISIQFQTGVTRKDKRAIQWYVDSINQFLKVLKPQSIIVYGSKLGHEVTWDMFPSYLHVVRVATVQDMRRYRYTPDALMSLKSGDAYEHSKKKAKKKD